MGGDWIVEHEEEIERQRRQVALGSATIVSLVAIVREAYVDALDNLARYVERSADRAALEANCDRIEEGKDPFVSASMDFPTLNNYELISYVEEADKARTRLEVVERLAQDYEQLIRRPRMVAIESGTE
ncbi:hypothetical protein [Azospirillum argentinense]|uniref:hypothetical protein n=1 Tax=Azospirillum argentinense TaxID=2970906 RepID=UPI001585FFEE|nr:hypothetical protein [Azospirillum argentinense]